MKKVKMKMEWKTV